MAKNNSKFADKKISSKQAEETKGGFGISSDTCKSLSSSGYQLVQGANGHYKCYNKVGSVVGAA